MPGEVHVPDFDCDAHAWQLFAVYAQPPSQIQALPLHVLETGVFPTGWQELYGYVAARHVTAVIIVDIMAAITVIFLDFIVLSFRLWIHFL